MIQYCYINGQLTDMQHAVVGVADLALLRGYGAFDYFLVRDYKPYFLEDYLERFFHSAQLLKLEMPFSLEALRQQVLHLLEANGQPDAGIRLLLTGGYAADGYTPTTPNLLVLQYKLPVYPANSYVAGIKMMSYQFTREMAEIKSLNYVTGIWLLDELKRQGASDALYHDGQYISESARSNIFMIDDTGTLCTPDKNILHGVTRKHILKVAETFMPVEIRPITLEEIMSAKEAFLSSSSKAVLPVTQIDETLIGDGQPGAKTMELSRRFLEYRSAMHAASPLAVK
jgi:branched-subunit amino acid aminotransferase/4-amino-4-deoxychorismate lyase